MKTLKTLSVQDVWKVHVAICEDFKKSDRPIFPEGTKDQGMLESAVNRQHAGWENRVFYSDPYSNAATLTYGLCCDHPFHNGNKRTALVSMLLHLHKNGLALSNVGDRDLEKMILKVAEHIFFDFLDHKLQRKVFGGSPYEKEVAAIAVWLRHHSRPGMTRGETEITYHELTRILRKHKISLEEPHDNKIHLVRYEDYPARLLQKAYRKRINICTIPYPGDKSRVAIRHIKFIRQKCKLTDADGVDSHSFYNDEAMLSHYIHRYHDILLRLANK